MPSDIIYTDKAPKPIGPYSQAIKAGNFLFGSGQIPIDPKTGEIVKGDIKQQTNQVMENIKAVLEAAGMGLENIVSVFVFLRDLSLFADFNEEYSKFFAKNPPARTVVEVTNLPKGALLEISFIAYKGT